MLALVSAAWPTFDVTDDRVLLWYELLGDVDFGVAQVALKKLMLESNFPPSLAEMRRAIAEVTTPEAERLEAGEAWAQVRQAIRWFGYYRELEALESLSPVIAEAVKAIGWQEICATEEAEIVRAQFMRVYESIRKRHMEKALLPKPLQDQIRALGAGQVLKALPPAAGGEAQ